jgi:hypothetical protein
MPDLARRWVGLQAMQIVVSLTVLDDVDLDNESVSLIIGLMVVGDVVQ